LDDDTVSKRSVKHDVGAVNIDVIDGNCTVTVFMGIPATVVRAALLLAALDAVDTPATRPLEVMLECVSGYEGGRDRAR
jgi:hypothetical protein